MSLAILFHFLYAQHVSDINISIVRSLRLFCRITALVVLFLVRCVLEFRCGWVGVVTVLQAEQPATRCGPLSSYQVFFSACPCFPLLYICKLHISNALLWIMNKMY